MIIVGAGLAGLIAGNLFPESVVVEQNAEIPESHRAVLRFRSPAVGEAVGIQFKEVTVHKAIYSEFKFCQPNPRLANLYSQKVSNGLYDRSIWNLEPAKRWIAPEDLARRLARALGNRLKLSQKFEFPSDEEPEKSPIISTAPLFVLERLYYGDKIEFKRWPIYVQRFRIRIPSDVYQTIYYPDHDHSVYRASITGNMLIIEHENSMEDRDLGLETCLHSFSLDKDEVDIIDQGIQPIGKLVPIDERQRRSYILDLTRRMNIYSLGRFATWRNILLDDILKDIAKIKRMIQADEYGRELLRG